MAPSLDPSHEGECAEILPMQPNSTQWLPSTDPDTTTLGQHLGREQAATVIARIRLYQKDSRDDRPDGRLRAFLRRRPTSDIVICDVGVKGHSLAGHVDEQSPTARTSPETTGDKALREALDLFNEVRGEFAKDMPASALDVLYDRVDRLQLLGELDVIRLLLRAAAQNTLPLVALVGILTITLPWRRELGAAHHELACRAFDVAATERGKDEAVRLLDGLR